MRSTTTSSTLSTTELRVQGAPITLRDGSRIRIRQGHRADLPLLLRAFAKLSAETRYRRFLTPIPELSDSMTHELTDLDHRDREALVAIDDATGDGIAVARYVRDPTRPDVAEVAVTVTDEWQGRGLGTLLLELISARAREEGIATFTALMLATNEEMMDVIRSIAEPRIVDRDTGTVELEIPLPEIGVSPDLAKLLRIAAVRRSG